MRQLTEVGSPHASARSLAPRLVGRTPISRFIERRVWASRPCHPELVHIAFGAWLVMLVFVLMVGLVAAGIAPHLHRVPVLLDTPWSRLGPLLIANTGSVMFVALSMCLVGTASIVAPAAAASSLLETHPFSERVVGGRVSTLVRLMRKVGRSLFIVLPVLVLAALPELLPVWSWAGVLTPQIVLALGSVFVTASLVFCTVGTVCGALGGYGWRAAPSSPRPCALSWSSDCRLAGLHWEPSTSRLGYPYCGSIRC